MKPTPKDWPRLSCAAYYDDARAAIDFLCAAFGFKVRIKIEGEGGRIEHSELEYGEGLIMAGQTGGRPERAFCKSPRALGGANTQSMMLFVDDADAHCAHARAHGATIVVEPKTVDYGEGYWVDRSYEAVDLEGHHWWFTQRLS